ncbi:PVC-type heme-binding CxxCH protein [Halalkalibaculum sp. DA3122]|uniref:PVC-type heme-binding CxxCH protein n=1 Tax=Halalkalibaculum sp. DA3122 TaxID=3373607 RepID=UPI0037544E8E
MSRYSISTLLLLFVLLSQSYGLNNTFEQVQTADTAEIDREYTLEAVITGYTGIGGSIDGIRNPVLQAKKGETVRITIVNGETLTHDIVMEELGVKSEAIIEEGTETSITFVAKSNDTYYCSIPGHREAGMEGEFQIIEASTDEVVAEGVLPQKNGEPVNVDFEYATLDDWTAEGEAFEGQPTSDRSTEVYEEDMNINPSGQFYVSSGGTKKSTETGKLTSTSFEVTHPYAAFKVSGGALQETRVEIIDAETDEVIFQITGNDHQRLRPVVVDLQDQMGEQIFIKLIDNETGVSEIPYIGDNIWAHISFDDFRFYSNRPDFPDELNPEDIVILPPRDMIENAGLSGEEAAKEMELPEGFSVQLAASEPDVIRPIAFTIDDRGRLWVAEAHTYPEKAPEGEGEDRILIFEDTTGDGKLDKRTVFIEGLNLVSGIEIGHGGVWVGAAPEFLYIPIDESGNKPAGDPKVLLDGWGYEDTHETLNSFRWGPDGWLYGTHGVFTHSKVGKPGTHEDERLKLNAGVWRYHPTRHEFEVFAYGTSNPWGIDFNKYGHPFITACVIPHLYHVIQGGRYLRQAGEHFNDYIYDDIGHIADHVHWVGDNGPHAGNHRSGSAGGGHAHAGAMFYQGAEHWPEEYDNMLFMNNIHGYRTNADKIERKGSGYTATHAEDFLKTHDSWSQWLDFRYMPGGSVYAIDWYDKNQCHSPNPAVHDKSLGRIYNIRHELDEYVQVNLKEKSSLELVEYQLHHNEWYVRHAQRILQERGPDQQVHNALKEILNQNPDITRKLRALWSLHVTHGLTDQDYIDLLDHENEYMRSWAIQLLAEDENVPEKGIQKLENMAYNDNSALVRLYITSALQRMEPAKRWGILEGLYTHSEDAGDHNLPLMAWFAAEPLVEKNMDRALDLAMESELPTILPYTIKRVAAVGTDQAMEKLENVEKDLKDKPNTGQYDQARQELDLIFGQAR